MTDATGLARAALAAFASGETGDAERYIGADYANLESSDRSTARGPAEFRETVQWMHRSFADIRYDEIAILADDRQAIAWVVMHATHIAPFLGIPADQRKVAVEQVHLFRVEEGRLTGHRAVRDDLRLLLMIGARVTRPDGAPLAVHQR
ncbi:MAG TPA: ester cyclase [Stellaceae bacterium]|nr:ester cyclase [Stellaceae bacterium]